MISQQKGNSPKKRAPLSPELSEILEAGRGDISSAIDAYISTHDMSAGELNTLAAVASAKLVRAGSDLGARRAICRIRIENGMTLQRLALSSPFSYSRLKDIEDGRFDLIRPAECRFFEDMFGVMIPISTLDVFCEPSGEGILLKLKDLDGFDNHLDLQEYADRHCTRRFCNGEIQGASGILIDCSTEEVGLPFPGRALLTIDELIYPEEDALYVCRFGEKKIMVLQYRSEKYCSLDGSVSLESEEIRWILPVKQLNCKIY